MTATFAVRPGVAGVGSGRRSMSCHLGLTLIPAPPRHGWSGVESRKLVASWVPTRKLLACCEGTPGQPLDSHVAGGMSGLQNGTSGGGPFGPTGWCGNVSLRPWPWTS
jgi:hypothetical protein